MLLVTGATGQLGSAVVTRLLERVEAKELAVLVRDEAKVAELARRGVTVVSGDYDDTERLRRAFVDVEKVLLIAGNDPERRVQQHQNVIDAAKHAKVRLLGFTSRSLRDIRSSQNTLMADYFATEDRIRRSGVPHILFRNALYLDTVPLYVAGDRVFDTGIALPAGDGKVAYALRRELGEALANGMVDHSGVDRTYVVSAPKAHSFNDIAETLTEISGRRVVYRDIGDDDFVAETVQRGVPEPAARRFLGFFSDIRDNQLDETSTDFSALLGREPISLADGLRELFHP